MAAAAADDNDEMKENVVLHTTVFKLTWHRCSEGVRTSSEHEADLATRPADGF